MDPAEYDELVLAPDPDHASDDPPKNAHATALGRLGGKRGGVARAISLSAERRSEIARTAAQARWRSDDRGTQGEQG